jgi:uncharacterized membrane protein
MTMNAAALATPPAAADEHRIVLAPHCSLTPRSARLFFALVATTTFAVAIFFAARGFWPVLPCAGLEMALLAWALGVSMRRGAECETITISAQSIVVDGTRGPASRRAVFPRHWTRVKRHAPPVALHPGRLLVETHVRVCEVGRFLTESERRGLAARLKQLVGGCNESPAL